MLQDVRSCSECLGATSHKNTQLLPPSRLAPWPGAKKSLILDLKVEAPHVRRHILSGLLARVWE